MNYLPTYSQGQLIDDAMLALKNNASSTFNLFPALVLMIFYMLSEEKEF
jgi:hypothetical protein